MIHEDVKTGTYTISSRGQWLPGVYDRVKTARWAFQFPNEVLQSLNDQICHVNGENRPITAADLERRRPRRLGATGS